MAADSAPRPMQLLRDTLDELGMTQATLAMKTGLSAKHVNQIAQDAAGITGRTAVLFERATGVPASQWLLAEMTRQEAEARAELDGARRKSAVDYVRQTIGRYDENDEQVVNAMLAWMDAEVSRRG